jgi:hypothetical protein
MRRLAVLLFLGCRHMYGSAFSSGVCMKSALSALLLLPLACTAETAVGVTGALNFTVIIPPVFRVLQVTPVTDGYEYRVWTNKPSVMLNGREYRFHRVGETTLKIPTPPQRLLLVHGL